MIMTLTETKIDTLHHPAYGDLSHHQAVNLLFAGSNHFSFNLNEPPYIHLSITGRCYARCRGCVNAAITSSYAGDRRDIIPIADTDPVRDVACISHLIKEMEEGPVVICLYGGEPLLETKKIAEVYQLMAQARLPHEIRYMLYTNGDLLQNAITSIPEIMADIWLYTVSIDGRENQHNTVRLGTNLKKIHSGLAALRAIRTGTVVMWSTLREEQSLLDCYEEFLTLYKDKLADQFYFHWVETADPFKDLQKYAKQYGQDLQKIMEDYIDNLCNGLILPIVHINELLVYLLTGHNRGSSACGVELAQNYDIINGVIHACADLPPELAIGTIDESGKPQLNHKDLTFLVSYKERLRCYECGVHAYCGGRCPVQAYSGGERRMEQYCQLMRLHVATVKDYLDRIIAAMQLNSLTAQDLYDASGFYAQFTDVTP
jgi:radical SAM protein with 4Fe4S-binding SPASM domain